MTPREYWTRWLIAGLVSLAAARLVLVQPIVEACR